MKYSLSNQHELRLFKDKVNQLIEKLADVELKIVRKQRTIRQNSYLHVCITLFAIHFGYTIDEAKTLLKRKCGFMTYEKNGTKFLRSTAKLDTLEMIQLIDFIRTFASIEGCYIPTSEEYLENKFFIDNEIELQKQYL